MDKKSFLASGHLPTLISAFLYFDVSFMVWVLLGPLSPFIAEQIHLSATQKGLLTAIPSTAARIVAQVGPPVARGTWRQSW